jgi:hypothetical protein
MAEAEYVCADGSPCVPTLGAAAPPSNPEPPRILMPASTNALPTNRQPNILNVLESCLGLQSATLALC